MYPHTFVNRRGGKYVSLQKIEPRTKTVGCVVFDNLSERQWTRLQMILAYGGPVPAICYRCHLVRMMSETPYVTVGELAEYVIADQEWVRKLLGIREGLPLMSVSNAYFLSRIKNPFPEVVTRATVMSTAVFMKEAQEMIAEQRRRK